MCVNRGLAPVWLQGLSACKISTSAMLAVVIGRHLLRGLCPIQNKLKRSILLAIESLGGDSPWSQVALFLWFPSFFFSSLRVT